MRGSLLSFNHFLFSLGGGEGFQLGNAFEFVCIIIEVIFWLPFTYHENSEIKVTVKLTGSMVVPATNANTSISSLTFTSLSHYTPSRLYHSTSCIYFYFAPSPSMLLTPLLSTVTQNFDIAAIKNPCSKK